MHKPRQRMAYRCMAILVAILAVVIGLYSYINAQIMEEHLRSALIQGADQLSRSIVASTWSSMLADRRDEAYRLMRAIGEEQRISAIRFLNKEGVVTFSTDPDAPLEVDKSEESCFICHKRDEPLVHLDMPNRVRIYEQANGRRALAMMTPIYSDSSCSAAPCHAHPPSQRVLGVLDVKLDYGHVDMEVTAARRRATVMAVVAVVLIGLFFSIWANRHLAVPIRQLLEGTRRVSDMQLDEPITVSTKGELADLGVAFDTMRQRLRLAIHQNEEFTDSLEARVLERSRQLRVAEERLVRSDRMASLGQLAASVAHEINNPVSAVLNFAVLMQRILRDDGIPPDRVADYRHYLTVIADETTRVGRIVSDLLSFSRRSTPQRTEHELNAIIESTLSLVTHKLELAEVDLVVELGQGLPPLYCDKSQIQQAVVNLVINASEAVQGPGGRVTVRTSMGEPGDPLVLEVSDTGAGIAPEHVHRIFDPFFSTKADGKGVGLGLSVVYGIVEAHGGTTDVKSDLGRGTTFTVHLPQHPPPASAAAPPGEEGGVAGPAA